MATDKIISLDTLEEVERPQQQPETPAKPDPSEDENDEEEEEEEESPAEAEEESEEESDPEETEEETEEEAESDGEEAEAEDEEEDDSTDPDEFIKNKFGEEYGIENEEQFKEVLDRATELLDENENLKKELEEAKKAPKEPVFKSESQKKVYDILKDYDPEKIPDGLHMLATLVGMEVDKTDTRLVLEQEFIMRHPELSIDRARKKFQRDYDRKYVIDEDNFEGTREQLQEKKEDIESDLDIELARAKKFIKEKQQEFKLKSENKEEKTPEVNEELQSNIAKNMDEFAEHFQDIHTLTFEIDENDKHPFHFKFNDEELKKIKSVVDNFLKNPASYDKNGKVIGGFNAEERFIQAANLVAGTRITEEALKFAKKHAHMIKADEIATKKPKRKAKSSGDAKSMDPMDQFERLAKQKALKQSA
jgi:hypothetical protein